MILSLIASFVGGLGLFLLGMRLMTGGLRHAAGNALRGLLGRWTRTPLHGIASGFLITSLVQSSSAVTVAVIGFVNAGLMTMGQSVGVIYGSNIGTTATSWIVAAVGVNVKVKALALPFIGVGALLRLTGGQTRRTHLGDALAGFGIFFLGIEVLQSAFQSLGTAVDLPSYDIGGIPGILLFVAVGAVLTLLMQSSSAAMALVLTATMSGIISLESAAAAAIGTNIGTTSTALLSVLGATHNAVKVAVAHILFNLGTGLVALAAIRPLLLAVTWLTGLLDGGDPATSIAVFHTLFNILGVSIFLPCTGRMVAFLDRRIGREAAMLGKPRYIDDNILTTPSLAMDALFMELGRMGEMVRLMCQKGLNADFRHKDFYQDKATFESLSSAIRSFCVKIQRLDLPEQAAATLPVALRVNQYFRRTVDIMTEMNKQFDRPGIGLPEHTARFVKSFKEEIRDILNVAHTPCSPEFSGLRERVDRLEDTYQTLKEDLLKDGASGKLSLTAMVANLEFHSRLRAMCEKAVKGTTFWSLLRDLDLTCAAADEANDYSWKQEA
ncbi:MAG: Na/Pi cotransporter family protein [Desulfovibrionaceae bacterium]|nr:Na/Pi cotransporter family protein [Desulfovibrionaceae bacterium]